MSPNIPASVKARLLNGAKARGEEFERTLTRYAAERLLYRLGASEARESCLLKGASLLSVWLSDPYRVTRDVDVLAFGPAEDEWVRGLLETMCAVSCVEDGLRFDLSDLSLDAIRADQDFLGRRARFFTYLGKARIRVQMDIGFGDALAVEAEEVVYPTMLDTLPTPRLRGYPREMSVAEKFEAMVKLDLRNSRMKDFHDIWALAGAFEFDGRSLRKAIAACFERRTIPWTLEKPSALTRAFYGETTLETRWRSYLAAGAVLVPPPAQFEIIGERIIQFLGPVRDSLVAGDSFERTWREGGPWQ